MLPAPKEVVFGTDCSTGQASMTWCYPQPRVVTHLSVTPVPLTLPQQLDANFIDETLKVLTTFNRNFVFVYFLSGTIRKHYLCPVELYSQEIKNNINKGQIL